MHIILNHILYLCYDYFILTKNEHKYVLFFISAVVYEKVRKTYTEKYAALLKERETADVSSSWERVSGHLKIITLKLESYYLIWAVKTLSEGLYSYKLIGKSQEKFA